MTETATERTLEVEVRGDIEALIAFGLDVKETAQQLRFLLDRRNMHPFLTLSTARLGEGAGFDAVATALNDFESEPWQATHLSMRKQTYGAAGDSEEVASIELPQG